jgi:hypothetical protein
LDRFALQPGVSAYRYRTPQKEHLFFVPEGNGPWRCLGWESDASFVHAVFDRFGGKLAIAFCSGSYVDMEGNRILSTSKRVRYAWGKGKPGEIVLLASDPKDEA